MQIQPSQPGSEFNEDKKKAEYGWWICNGSRMSPYVVVLLSGAVILELAQIAHGCPNTNSNSTSNITNTTLNSSLPNSK